MTTPAKGLRRPLEKNVEAAIDRLLGSCGWRIIRFSQARASNQTAGIPDRRYVHRQLGIALWFEAKRPGGKWSDEQQKFAEDCLHSGEIYVVGGLEEAYQVLQCTGCFDGKVLRPNGYSSLKNRAAVLQQLDYYAIESRAKWRNG